MQITIAPRSSDNAIGAYIEKNETNTAVYDNFFKTVYEKNITASV